MEDSATRFAIEQTYTQEMSQYFNPLMVVATILAKVDINPYIIKDLDIRFIQGDGDMYYNKVRLIVELNMAMSDGWIGYLKDKISYLMKDAFCTSYGKKADKWFSFYDKEPPFFSKEFVNEAIQDK
jgi:hypothetical protein